MNFINPIEILNLQNAPYAGRINSDIIKKEKKKLFIEIELSDDKLYNYHGLKISKSDCERVINELDNEETKEFYFSLCTNAPLNNLLAFGDKSFFSSFRQESIYKLPEFIEFINPFFANRFDEALVNAFNDNNVNRLQSILRTQFLVNQTNINVAFKSVSSKIETLIDEFDEITQSVNNGELADSGMDDGDLVAYTLDSFNIDIINCLPSYFQSQINKIASTLNYLDLALDKHTGTKISSIHLLEHLLKLNIESVHRKTYENNLAITKRKYNEKIEEERNAPVLSVWAKIIVEINTLTEKIEEKTIGANLGLQKINLIDISELNSLPAFADDIRNSFAYAFRSMSISIWNEHKEIDMAISIVKKGLLINSSKETKNKLNEDLNKLLELKKEKEMMGTPISSVPDLSTTSGVGNAMIDDTLFFVILHIPILPIARYNVEKFGNSYRFYGKLKLHTWQKVWQWGLPLGVFLFFAIPVIINEFENKEYSNNYTPTPPSNSNENTSSYNDKTTTTNYNTTPYKPYEEIIEESKYKGKQLKNGASPFNDCFGKGKYNGNAKLTVKNGSKSDAIVCIYSVYNEQTIRNSYVRANTNFTISNIAQGEYKIRVFYGNDWNPTAINECGTKGMFDSNVSFSEFDRTEYFEDSDRGYTVATITLYSVIGGNASSSSIDKSKFFNK